MGLDIYAEELISNYEHPSNKRPMKDATVSAGDENSSCGDDIVVHLKIAKDKVKDASFEGSGLRDRHGHRQHPTEYLKGKSLREVEKMTAQDLLKLININPGPVRIRCATLSLRRRAIAPLRRDGGWRFGRHLF